MDGERLLNLAVEAGFHQFLDENRVEVVTGANLPMLVKVARIDESMRLSEAAELARDYGRRNISVASEILASRNGSEGGK